jgi:aminocarboxymuconate-semialdehyde decarboxylase
LKIAFAHGGGAFPGAFARMRHAFEVRPDLMAVQNPHDPEKYLKRIYVDSLVHDEKTLNFLLQVYGADRMALGSDYPFPLGEEKPGEMLEGLRTLDPATKKRLFSGTALEWLGMKEEDFL